MVKGIAILFTVFIIAIIIMLFVLYSKTVGVYMYNFPNFDNDTRFIMVSELVRDIESGLFYEPSSLKNSYIARYKELLRKCFEYGTVEGLERALVSSLFKDKDKSGRKIPSNIFLIVIGTT